MTDRAAAPAPADNAEARPRPPHTQRDGPPICLVLEAQEVTEVLAGTLDRAGIRLPQFHSRQSDTEDWVIRLGDCNVGVGLDLANLCRDGLTLRQKHPEESVNARS